MKFILLFFLFLYLLNGFLFAQTNPSENIFEISDSQELLKMYKEFTDIKFLFAPIDLELEYDTNLSGLFLGLINKEVHILKEKKILFVSVDKIKSIKISYKDLCHNDFFNAFFMGAYAMLLFYQFDNYNEHSNWSFLREKNEDSFLLDPRFLSSFACASASGILSYALNKTNRKLDIKMKEELFTDEDINFEFTKLIKGETNSKKIHFKFQFGWINPVIKNLSTNSIIPVNNTYYIDYEKISNFNSFRNINISYSIFNDLDIGVSYYNLTEKDNRFSADSFYLTLRYENSVYMLTASYYPFKKWLPSLIDFNVGAGVGLANINFSYPEINYILWSQNNNEITHKTNNYNKFCLSANIDLGINLTNNFALGISSDYFIIPGEFFLPDVNNKNIFVNKINLSNYFIGFYIKYNLIDYF